MPANLCMICGANFTSDRAGAVLCEQCRPKFSEPVQDCDLVAPSTPPIPEGRPALERVAVGVGIISLLVFAVMMVVVLNWNSEVDPKPAPPVELVKFESLPAGANPSTLDTNASKDNSTIIKPTMIGVPYIPAVVPGEKSPETTASTGIYTPPVSLDSKTSITEPAVVSAPSENTVLFRRELVRVNHLKNCQLCHPASGQATDLVRGAIPNPSLPLPASSSPVYYSQGESFVSAGKTFLKQDFSVVQPVVNPGNWSEHQRYDYFVSVRPVSVNEAEKYRSTGEDYRRAIAFGLRSLGETEPKVGAQPAESAGQPYLAQAAAALVAAKNPAALLDLFEAEYAKPLFAMAPAELEAFAVVHAQKYGPSLSRLSFTAYFESHARKGDPKAKRLVATLCTGYDADLPARLRMAAQAPALEEPATVVRYGRYGADAVVVVRISTKTTESLERELLGFPEREFASTSKNSSQHPLTQSQTQPELATLPFIHGSEAALSRDKLQSLHAMSLNFRETMQASMNGRNDSRPDLVTLKQHLMGGELPPNRLARTFTKKTDWMKPDAVPCIQQMFAAENASTRALGCELLAKIEGTEATETLVRWAVFDTEASNRSAAIRALRTRDSALVVPQLLSYLRYPWLRAVEHAVEALAALKAKEAIPELLRCYRLPDPTEAFAVSLDRDPRIDPVVAMAAKLEAERKAAALALETELQRQRDQELRAEVARLAVELQRPEVERRIRAMNKLGDCGPIAIPSVRVTLAVALLDEELAIRVSALETLGKLAPKCKEHVQAMIEKRTASEKLAAMNRLGELGKEAFIAIPLLLKFNDKPSLWGGGKKGHESLFPIIASIDINDPLFGEVVLAFVKAPNASGVTWIRERREAGMAHLNSIPAQREAKIEALVSGLDDPDTAIAVIHALQEYGKDAAPALPKLRKLKESASTSVRATAILAITKIE